MFSTPYPETSWRIAWLHSLFGNAPAVASGVAAAYKAMGREDIRVVAQGGDGGTVDIGFGCLSGMFERNDDVLYICYDNEAYMNTGIQRSGATPPAARTATTQAVGEDPGNTFGQGKDLPRIAMAHEIPYVATASVADLRDLEAKVHRAMSMRGARYIHVMVPCPLGWGTASGDTIKVARLATQSGIDVYKRQVMVCMDGFILTHAVEEVDVPEAADVARFLPPFEPRQVLDPANPVSIGAMVGPEAFTEVRYLAHERQMQALDLIPAVAAEFQAVFGRDSGGLLHTYEIEDAETVVIALGSVLGTIKDVVDELSLIHI